MANGFATKGVFGPSGIVYPNGENVQFTSEQADNIVVVGPSGAVTKDGNNIQFTEEGVPARAKRSPGFYGYSGIVYPNGQNVQFTREQADNIALIGPAGVVMRDGTNVQFNSEGLPARRKRDTYFTGPSGMYV